jgi:DNA repair ATPase RecN
MLTQVEVRNYQSLPSAVIPLGRLTVITGPTGSGKSALFRAVMLLAGNARGTSYITEAEKSCTVATGNDRWAACITRTNSPRGRNEYATAVLSGDGRWVPAKYTKLGGQVPAQVADLLGLTDLNFAEQLDPPYLLTEPGTVVARRLGDLTNVSLVFGAAAEANRRRKQFARDLEAARARWDALQAEAREFTGLRERRAATGAAERLLEALQATAARRERLAALTDRLEAAEAASRRARAEAERQAPPSLEKLDALAARASRLRALAGVLQFAERRAAEAVGEAAAAREDEAAAHVAVHAALVKVGQCPTCGSVVRPD